MPKFRNKPVVIEAVRWSGRNWREVAEWAYGHVPAVSAEDWDSDKFAIVPGEDRSTLSILTLEGEMIADVGDWIIRGVKGEFSRCKPDIFEATYDRVP